MCLLILTCGLCSKYTGLYLFSYIGHLDFYPEHIIYLISEFDASYSLTCSGDKHIEEGGGWVYGERGCELCYYCRQRGKMLCLQGQSAEL